MDQLQIIYEDNHLLVINKPAGIGVQRDESGDTCLIDLAKSYLIRKYNKPGDAFVGLAHRIDRPVSGLVLMTKTSKALERIVKQFRDRQVVKTYMAVVGNKPKQANAVLIDYLYKDRQRNKVIVCKPASRVGIKKAETHFQFIADLGNRFLLQVHPISGRSHQIRVQLSAFGLPIVGDVKYGGVMHANKRQIMLHSYSLQFVHPVKREKMLLKCLPDIESWSPYRDYIDDQEL
jgi:23S rRNA pseudouridine1911/1915/1917 synthase